MQRLKAKFRVGSVQPSEGVVNSIALIASAVYGTEGENKDFTSVTPWGTLQMGIEAGAPAASVFQPGDEFYMYLEKIEKPAAEDEPKPEAAPVEETEVIPEDDAPIADDDKPAKKKNTR